VNNANHRITDSKNVRGWYDAITETFVLIFSYLLRISTDYVITNKVCNLFLGRSTVQMFSCLYDSFFLVSAV